MSKKDKISLKDFVLTYPSTSAVVPVVSPKQSFEDKMQELRASAVKYFKQMFWLLLQYSIWAFLLHYAYVTGGYSGLAISLGVAIIYKLDSVAKVRK